MTESKTILWTVLIAALSPAERANRYEDARRCLEAMREERGGDDD